MSDFDEPTTAVMPPASVQAEEALLGSFMIQPDLINDIPLNPRDFYIVRNRILYEAMLETWRNGVQVDYMTICTTLEQSGRIAEIGGPAYVMGLINQTPTSMHAASYAEIIRDRAQRRRLIQIASDLAKSAYDLTDSPETTVSQIATDLANSARPRGGAQHVSIFADRHYDRMTALANGERVVQRIPTGFLDFDKCLNGGLRIPEMLLLSGKPGLGKTKFIFQLAFNMGKTFPGAVYEMETDEDQIMDREFSRRTEIPDDHFETGRMQDDEWPLYLHEYEIVSSQDTHVYLDFGSGWTTATLRADLARLKAEFGIQWFMVDYMKFLRDSYGKDETERLNYISGQLKSINRDLGLASVIIHSMNKKGIESSSPDLTDQSGGADISFDTDKSVFMMPHIPGEGQPKRANYRTFLFRKSRSRLNGVMFDLEAVAEFPAFRDVATEHQTQTEPPPRIHREKRKPAPQPIAVEYEVDDLQLPEF